jgi:hypothetical protein
VSKIVGLSPKAANEVFSEFPSDENLIPQQMEFTKLIVNYIIKNGRLDKKVLNKHPSNKSGNAIKLFEGKSHTVKKIIGTIFIFTSSSLLIFISLYFIKCPFQPNAWRVFDAAGLYLRTYL